jgi:putative transposase
MTNASTHSTIPHAEDESSPHLFDDWFDPIEAAVRERVREFIQGLIEDELEATLLRPRYGRLAKTDAEGTAGPGCSARTVG